MAMLTRETLTVEKDTDGSVMVKVDVPGKTVNVFNRQLFADLEAALDCLRDAPGRIPVVVIRSGKNTGFIAGADLQEFLAIRTPAEAEVISARGQAIMTRLANLPIPTVAVIHGPCLGGGLEFALACDYRLVFDRPSTQLGLPEIELGLLPGWGGTQRLPALVGLEPALQVILGGKRLRAIEAYAWGLADSLAGNENELRLQFDLLKRRAIEQGKQPRTGLPLRTWRQKLLESNRFGRRLILRGAERIVRRKVPDDMPAPLEALEAVRIGLRQGEEAGFIREQQAAGRLAISAPCRNLIGLFFQREGARKLPAALEGLPPKDIRRVGVVGAGTMGAGIAQLAALKGCEVIVQEVNEEALGGGLYRITSLFHKAVERGAMSPDEAAKRLSAVKGTIRWEGFDQLDLVVEAAVENLEAKKSLFRDMARNTRPGTILVSNTSSLPLARLQEGLAAPERVAGLHFFNPVHKMPLVEVVRAHGTGQATLASLARFANYLGKTPVIVAESPGFIVNRILMPYLHEAVTLIGEGLPIDKIDQTMRKFGMPMGPLELLDQIGLDIAAHVAQSMTNLFQGRFTPSDAFARMRDNGWLGSKNGTGFYRHKGKKARANSLAQNLLKDNAISPIKLPLPVRVAEARERLVLLMVNEATLCLAEGVADSADAIDLAMVMGTGWAPHRGGPLRYADQRGLKEIVAAMDILAGLRGSRLNPCPELKRRASASLPFRPEPPFPAAP